MRMTLTNKMAVAERYPLTGPNEPVDEDVVHSSSTRLEGPHAYVHGRIEIEKRYPDEEAQWVVGLPSSVV